ncbi:MAG: Rpn family recombination-promoting nuclease/putative transposase [Pirellulaceae bacterium]
MDRRKLDEYLYSVRSVEKRIAGSDKLDMAEEGIPDYPRPAGVPREIQYHAELMLDMMTLAMQTDSTRIISFMFTNAGSNRGYPELEVREGHHELSHHGKSEDKQAKIATINRFYAARFAYFLKRLKEIPEGNGTLLDHSAIVYGSGISDGDRHNHDDLPILWPDEPGDASTPDATLSIRRRRRATCISDADASGVSAALARGPLDHTAGARCRQFNVNTVRAWRQFIDGQAPAFLLEKRYNELSVGGGIMSDMSERIGIRAWIDFPFKKIFGKPGNEICLISLLDSVLDLPEPIAAVEFLNPFSLKEFVDAKLICVDVKATDTQKRVFIVEVQLVVSNSFAKRAIYYAAKAYVDQLTPGLGYGKLKSTYAVCLLMRSLWGDQRLHHHFRLTEKGSGEVLQDAIEIHTVELSKYNKDERPLSQSSLLEQWCYWIKHSHEHSEEELCELLPGLAFLRATRELNAIREITEERQMYDSRAKAALDLQSGLIDAKEEGRIEGREEGRVEGREEGREEGRYEGREEGQIELIRTLQEILGEPVTEEKSLEGQTLEQLQAKAAALRNRILRRS